MTTIRRVAGAPLAALATALICAAAAFAGAKVTSADIANNTIKSVDVRDRSLSTKDLTKKTVDGLKGGFPATLPPGRSLQGTYLVVEFSGATSNPSAEFADLAIDYPIKLPFTPQLKFIQAGGGADDECPGTPSNPKASPGFLCVYENGSTNRDSGDVAFQWGDGRDQLGFGVSVRAASNTPGLYSSNGSWAVNVPQLF